MRVKHKFLDLYPLQGKKVVIIGTFNPDVTCIEIYKIKEFCDSNDIKFGFLPTPSRFYSETKLQGWRSILIGRQLYK